MITSTTITFPCGQVVEAEVHRISMFDNLGSVMKIQVKESNSLTKLLASNSTITVKLDLEYREKTHSFDAKMNDDSLSGMIAFEPVERPFSNVL